MPSTETNPAAGDRASGGSASSGTSALWLLPTTASYARKSGHFLGRALRITARYQDARSRVLPPQRRRKARAVRSAWAVTLQVFTTTTSATSALRRGSNHGGATPRQWLRHRPGWRGIQSSQRGILPRCQSINRLNPFCFVGSGVAKELREFRSSVRDCSLAPAILH